MKKTIVGVVTGIAAMLVVGCGNTAGAYDTDYAGFCMDRVHNYRVPDNMCANAGLAYWDYVDIDSNPGFIYPGYYSALPRSVVVVHTAPRNVTIVRNLSSTGGTARSLPAFRNSAKLNVNRPANQPVNKPANVAPKPNSSIQRGGFGMGSNNSFGRSSGTSSGS